MINDLKTKMNMRKFFPKVLNHETKHLFTHLPDEIIKNLDLILKEKEKDDLYLDSLIYIRNLFD